MNIFRKTVLTTAVAVAIFSGSQTFAAQPAQNRSDDLQALAQKELNVSDTFILPIQDPGIDPLCRSKTIILRPQDPGTGLKQGVRLQNPDARFPNPPAAEPEAAPANPAPEAPAQSGLWKRFANTISNNRIATLTTIGAVVGAGLIAKFCPKIKSKITLATAALIATLNTEKLDTTLHQYKVSCCHKLAPLCLQLGTYCNSPKLQAMAWGLMFAQ